MVYCLRLIRTLFEIIKEEKSSCTILFIDEIDGLCKKRTTGETDWNRRYIHKIKPLYNHI